MEAGIITLVKIIGTLVLCIGTIPVLFLLSPGDRAEPSDADPEH